MEFKTRLEEIFTTALEQACFFSSDIAKERYPPALSLIGLNHTDYPEDECDKHEDGDEEPDDYPQHAGDHSQYCSNNLEGDHGDYVSHPKDHRLPRMKADILIALFDEHEDNSGDRSADVAQKPCDIRR